MPQAQQYDPSNPQPYQAVELQQPTPAMPSPLPTEMPEANGAVRKSGGAATILDGVLRGIMRGKAYGEAKKVMQLKSKTDNLQASYNQDAQRLYQMHASGVDPNSDEYKSAASAVKGSWGAIMDFYGQHLGEDQGKGKNKSKVKKAEDGLAGIFARKDPMEMSQAAYQMAMKAGPPVFSQVAQLNTPQAKAQREAEVKNAQTSQTVAANTATKASQESTELQHQQILQDAQKKIDDLQKTPREQWTQNQWSTFNQAQQQLEERKPGDEPKVAADAILRKAEADPKYQFSDQDKEVMRAAGWKIDPKLKTQITKTGEIIQFPEDGGAPEILRGPQAAYETKGRGRGGSGGPGGAEDKVYKKWDAYYKEHHPELNKEDRDALVRRKVEGANQEGADAIAHDAIAEPEKFDNDVISTAIENVRKLPQYAKSTTFDDAMANIVGQGDNGYQYHRKSDVKGPDKNGKYSGDVTADQLKTMERDLQTQIRAVMSGSKLTGLSASERRTAINRMQPVFGPSVSQGSGTSQVSPPASAASPAAPASSPAPTGANHPKKGVVRKAAFLHANPGATDADWETMKPDLQNQGYETKD